MKTKLCIFDGCEKEISAASLCVGHYSQRSRGKKLTPLRNYSRSVAVDNKPRTEHERFDRYIDKTGDCWEWLGSVDKNGYAHFNLSAVNGGGRVQAHRYAHERFIGEIPPKYEVDHLCFNSKCVKPEHLEAVTKAENLRRKRKEHSFTVQHTRNTSGRVGVTQIRDGKLWLANLSYKGKKFKTTYHKTFEEAVASREAMERLALEEETL